MNLLSFCLVLNRRREKGKERKKEGYKNSEQEKKKKGHSDIHH